MIVVGIAFDMTDFPPCNDVRTTEPNEQSNKAVDLVSKIVTSIQKMSPVPPFLFYLSLYFVTTITVPLILQS